MFQYSNQILSEHALFFCGTPPVIPCLADPFQPCLFTHSSHRADGGGASLIAEIMCPSRSHLVTVYREDQKMDAALLLALMNGG